MFKTKIHRCKSGRRWKPTAFYSTNRWILLKPRHLTLGFNELDDRTGMIASVYGDEFPEDKAKEVLEAENKLLRRLKNG